MSVAFEVSALIPADRETVYRAWLSSDEHTLMTGSPARVSAVEGEAFEAWDGYIQGVNMDLEPPRRIRQLWRTVEFEAADQDSLLEIRLESEDEATRVTIHHSELPDHGLQYRQGWIDAYFTPMQAYFGQVQAGKGI